MSGPTSTAPTFSKAAPPSAAVGTLADVLPAVAGALGAPVTGAEARAAALAALGLPPAPRVLVVLVDGLGEQILRARSGHAPTLRSMLAASPVAGLASASSVLDVSYPSTTATSLASLGTGLLPGAHGMNGYQVRVPSSGALLNELSWEGGPDPRTWQPHPPVFTQVAAAGVDVTRVGPAHFDGSGLTEAALRGGRYRSARTLPDRVDAALSALSATPRSLVYLYWGDVDKTGHTSGVASTAWGTALEEVDEAIAVLVSRLPSDALMVVTADHGMVDVPTSSRTDLAHDAELAAGVELTGGEPRAPMLYCRPGAAGDVAATWRGRFGDDLDVLLREEAQGAGWFGPVAEHVLPRIGDVVVAARAPISVHDSRVQRAALADLVGMHGALTDAEVRVPLLTVAGRAL